MKDEFEKKLIEQPEADDLGIKATMEGIEPEEGARERMLQNIMKKAAVLHAAESGEAPKAEILSLGAAKKAAGLETHAAEAAAGDGKKAEKTKKNRWKLYVPMLAAAALILTVGTIFFVKLGMEKMSGSEMVPGEKDVMANGIDAPNGLDAVTSGTKAPGDQFKEQQEDNMPYSGSQRAESLRPAENTGREDEPAKAPNDGADIPLEDFRHDGNTASIDPYNMTGAAVEPEQGTIGPVLNEEVFMDTPEGQATYLALPLKLRNAVSDLEVVKLYNGIHDQSIYVLYEGHEYMVQCSESPDSEKQVTTQKEVDFDCIGRETVVSEGMLRLEKITFRDYIGWWGEWSPDGLDWYYLYNEDSAPLEDVKALIGIIQKNVRNGQ